MTDRPIDLDHATGYARHADHSATQCANGDRLILRMAAELRDLRADNEHLRLEREENNRYYQRLESLLTRIAEHFPGTYPDGDITGTMRTAGVYGGLEQVAYLVERLRSQQPAPSNFELTREFHRAIGQLPEDYAGEHTNPERYRTMVELRSRLLREESREAIDALDAYAVGQGSLVDVAGELADVLCVTYGAAAALGIPMDAIYREFHRSVMTKVGGPVRADGKVLKGEGFQPPDLERVLSQEEPASDRHH